MDTPQPAPPTRPSAAPIRRSAPQPSSRTARNPSVTRSESAWGFLSQTLHVCHICRPIDPSGTTTPTDRYKYASPMECLVVFRLCTSATKYRSSLIARRASARHLRASGNRSGRRRSMSGGVLGMGTQMWCGECRDSQKISSLGS